jgi:hypothetical protein
MNNYYSIDEENRIDAEHSILRSGKANDVVLCKYESVSCIRCCLPHIGGDTHMEDSEDTRNALRKSDSNAYSLRYAGRYLGPRSILMKFTNYNPLKDPRIEASQYEDSLPDVGREEMERRFTERRRLFLDLYDRRQPRQSLQRYMKAAQESEGYRYKHGASAGPVTQYFGGSVPKRAHQSGELPECQLLGFVDAKETVGCMAHPLAEASQGYDGRDQAGFFNHTGCCENVGCQASYEFKFLSQSALKYSRHATSVLVYYLRSYDHLLQMVDEPAILDALSLDQLVAFTNALYEEWPLRNSQHPPVSDSALMNSLAVLSASIPLSERILYIALDTWFSPDRFARQLQQARAHISGALKRLKSRE